VPLFKCEDCGCVENTATGAFWGREKKLCSECSTGTWHGIFPKKTPEEKVLVERGQYLEPPGGWK